jgi:hypothetical protein
VRSGTDRARTSTPAQAEVAPRAAAAVEETSQSE